MYATATAAAALQIPFRLDSVAPATVPENGEGPWHSYVIRQGSDTITGIRAGTHDEVVALVQEMVERLNQRCEQQQAKLKRWEERSPRRPSAPSSDRPVSRSSAPQASE